MSLLARFDSFVGTLKDLDARSERFVQSLEEAARVAHKGSAPLDWLIEDFNDQIEQENLEHQARLSRLTATEDPVPIDDRPTPQEVCDATRYRMSLTVLTWAFDIQRSVVNKRSEYLADCARRNCTPVPYKRTWLDEKKLRLSLALLNWGTKLNPKR